MIIPKEKYNAVLNQMNRIHDSKYNAERYQVLSRLGIQIQENSGSIHIIHKDLEQAMAGLFYLCKAPDSKYRWMNYLRLDYKNAYAPIPTVDDICKTLPPGSSEIVKSLEEHLSGLIVKSSAAGIKTKIRPLRGIVSDFKWKVEY